MNFVQCRARVSEKAARSLQRTRGGVYNGLRSFGF